MKILALTTFVICLISVLSLKVESFETNEAETMGNFSATCKGIKLSGTKLSGQCKNKKGKYVKTTLALNTCVGNNNGKLVAHSTNYHKSSKACKVAKNVLNCQSKNRKGKFLKASLSLNTFISNINGVLKCDKAAKKVAAKKAAGFSGYAKTCSKVSYNAKTATLTGTCKNKKGKGVKATLKVGNCLTNNNGKLAHGKAFHKSSKGCKLAKSTINCQSKNKKGKWVKSSFDLNKIVGNINGALKC